MPTFKTPDVYIREISTIPPSVNEVETAVAAFIGYTETASKYAQNDLHDAPTRITSLLEYQELFGGAPPNNVQSVVLDENNVVRSQDIRPTFYTYDSLRLFFQNGGGHCYIVSVGSYQDTVRRVDFLRGLNHIRKKDEPTLILFPDATLLQSNKDLYNVQQEALRQCSDLGDRFCIFDLLDQDADSSRRGQGGRAILRHPRAAAALSGHAVLRNRHDSQKPAQ